MLTNRFKIVLVGDANVGKTAFIHRHLTGDFKSNYERTLGVDVYPLVFNTTEGKIMFGIALAKDFEMHITPMQRRCFSFSMSQIRNRTKILTNGLTKLEKLPDLFQLLFAETRLI